MNTPSLAVGMKQAADALCLSLRQIGYLVEQGEIETFRVGSRRLIRTSALEKYVARREAAERAERGVA